jgi:hypothetical protein
MLLVAVDWLSQQIFVNLAAKTVPMNRNNQHEEKTTGYKATGTYKDSSL